MDQGPLVIEEIDAGLEFARAFDKLRHVTAAFWLKPSDEHRYLYLASEDADGAKKPEAYGDVLTLANQMESIHFDPFQVRLIGADHPLARAAQEIHQNFPGRLATRFGGRRFGGLSVDDVYLYPSPLPAPAG